MEPATIFITVILLFPFLFLLTRRVSYSRKVPPGSLGLPVIGQGLSLLKAMKANKGEEWLHERARKYGPVSKLQIFGTPTVFIQGPAANKFMFTCSEELLSNQQPPSMSRLLGERNVFELSGDDHRRVRGAFVSFLKPETLKQYVGRMDEEIRRHLKEHWYGKQQVLVMPLMKTLTFNVICTLLLGIERGTRREVLVGLFEDVLKGFISLPINLPYTTFNRSLKARDKIRTIIMELIHEKRQKMEENGVSSQQDLITCFLSTKDETSNSPVMSNEEIVSNIILAMIAGHDTTSILLTFLVKLLAEDPTVYGCLLNEQEEISRGKASGELLKWDDLVKMKYTWSVATEMLRMNTPTIFNIRTAINDIEYGGYVIPKGWQVMCCAFMTHMDENIYPESWKFNPLRSQSQPSTPPFSYIPFGGGPRMCPGYELARIETLATIHYLVNEFKWNLSLEDNFFSREPLPVFRQGLPIQIQLKKSTDAI